MACELSGAQWVERYPTSVSVDDLSEDFKPKVQKFIKALEDAGVTVAIAATYRPVERSYLMHYAYKISNENLDPSTVPVYPGIEITWAHPGSGGSVDLEASKTAAQQMVTGYSIKYAPALNSRHNTRQAIDMNTTWSGTLTIIDGSNKKVTIKSDPQSGENTELHTVGSSYGVIKLVVDKPHWSSDGS